jgi:hypothetical protein
MEKRLIFIIYTFLLIACGNNESIEYTGFDDLVIGSETINLFKDGKFEIEIGLEYHKGTYNIKGDTVFLKYDKVVKLPNKFLLTDSVFKSIDFERVITINRRDKNKIARPPRSTSKGFDNKYEFQILSKTKLNDYSASYADTAICKHWDLDKVQITNIIKGSNPITGPEWHYQFDHLPCSINGKIIQNEQEYEYSINGGAWFMIHVKDTSFIFGSFSTENDKYFLSEPWVEE